jgi:NAD(P)-dependent dehydrogenase (short-subunit alcohol dehydrogenase family)
MNKIAILGNGDLSKALQTVIPNEFTVFKRPELDFFNDATIQYTAQALIDYPTIINCIGLFSGGDEQVMQSNFIGPMLLVKHLIELKYTGHLVMIGSHSATWTSWPGIDYQRLIYGNSKLALRNLILGLAQSHISNIDFTIIDITKFKSKMSNGQGYNPEKIAKLIYNITQQDVKILHVEAH